MIDTHARSQLAEAIRALVSGAISNDEFEARVPSSGDDPAIAEVFGQGAWMLYSDLHTHRLSGTYRLPALPSVPR